MAVGSRQNLRVRLREFPEAGFGNEMIVAFREVSILFDISKPGTA
jgi:hypothetical protein